MTLKTSGVEWNKYAVATTVFFVVFLVLKLLPLIPSLQLIPHCLESSCPRWWTEIQMTLISISFLVGGIAGLKASQLFGGRKNFTGRLISYFSLFLFALGPVWQFLIYLDAFPNPLYNWFSWHVLLPYSGVDIWENTLSFCLPAYGMLVSLKAVWKGYDSKSLIVLLCSFLFSLFVGLFSFVYADPAMGLTTTLDAVLNIWIWSVIVFVNLVAGVLLIRALGKWYVNRSITTFVVLYLFLGVIVGWAMANLPFAWPLTSDLAAYYGSFASIPYFFVSLLLTQVKPRITGPYFN